MHARRRVSAHHPDWTAVTFEGDYRADLKRCVSARRVAARLCDVEFKCRANRCRIKKKKKGMENSVAGNTGRFSKSMSPSTCIVVMSPSLPVL